MLVQVKGYIKKQNKKFTLSAVTDLTYKGFRRVEPKQWWKNDSHVRNKVEDHSWIADTLQEELAIGFRAESNESLQEESSNSWSDGSNS